jgi:hypothetical protein
MSEVSDERRRFEICGIKQTHENGQSMTVECAKIRDLRSQLAAQTARAEAALEVANNHCKRFCYGEPQAKCGQC